MDKENAKSRLYMLNLEIDGLTTRYQRACVAYFEAQQDGRQEYAEDQRALAAGDRSTLRRLEAKRQAVLDTLHCNNPTL